ncbi:MAG: MotA/TolQ/ExbB proton channel family protein [Kiritimatiellales bacterium]
MVFGLSSLLISGVLFTAYGDSSLSGKVIVWILLASSVGVWTVMITKFSQINAARRESDGFLRAFHSERLIGGLKMKNIRYPQSPLYALYEIGMKALSNEFALLGVQFDQLLSGALDEKDFRRLNPSQLEAIRIVMDRTMADEALRLEEKMGVLATAVNACPFLGLLGTVWGVMEAFAGIATAGSAVLSAVAPGISSALLTTVVGLIVALPSSIGYNILTARIRQLTVQMDNFVQEFGSAVQQRYSVYGAE